MSSTYGNFGAPANEGAAVTASDTTILAPITRGLYVGTTGDVAVQFSGAGGGGGSTVTLVSVPAGAVLPISVRKVLSTGTTASNIVALY